MLSFILTCFTQVEHNHKMIKTITCSKLFKVAIVHRMVAKIVDSRRVELATSWILRNFQFGEPSLCAKTVV